MYTCRFRRLWPFVLICGACLAAAAVSRANADSVALHKRFVRGASAIVVTANLNDPAIRIEIGLPQKGLSHSESFSEMVRRNKPIAAVTGTYFDTRTLLPVGTIVMGGKAVHVSCIGTTICFASTNKVWFVDTARDERDKTFGVDYALRAGPRLLNGGRYALDARREGFRDPGIFGRRSRMALGTTAHNKLLLVAVRTPVTFGRLATIMKTLGAVDAVCLDGGTSSAIYYRGRVVVAPGRKLTNIIQVRRVPAEQQELTVPAEADVAERETPARVSSERNPVVTTAQNHAAAAGEWWSVPLFENQALPAGSSRVRPQTGRGDPMPNDEKLRVPRRFDHAA